MISIKVLDDLDRMFVYNAFVCVLKRFSKHMDMETIDRWFGLYYEHIKADIGLYSDLDDISEMDVEISMKRVIPILSGHV